MEWDEDGPGPEKESADEAFPYSPPPEALAARLPEVPRKQLHTPSRAVIGYGILRQPEDIAALSAAGAKGPFPRDLFLLGFAGCLIAAAGGAGMSLVPTILGPYRIIETDMATVYGILLFNSAGYLLTAAGLIGLWRGYNEMSGLAAGVGLLISGGLQAYVASAASLTIPVSSWDMFTGVALLPGVALCMVAVAVHRCRFMLGNDSFTSMTWLLLSASAGLFLSGFGALCIPLGPLVGIAGFLSLARLFQKARPVDESHPLYGTVGKVRTGVFITGARYRAAANAATADKWPPRAMFAAGIAGTLLAVAALAGLAVLNISRAFMWPGGIGVFTAFLLLYSLSLFSIMAGFFALGRGYNSFTGVLNGAVFFIAAIMQLLAVLGGSTGDLLCAAGTITGITMMTSAVAVWECRHALNREPLCTATATALLFAGLFLLFPGSVSSAAGPLVASAAFILLGQVFASARPVGEGHPLHPLIEKIRHE